MNCWQILGIAPTTSKRDIKLAYTNQLKRHNPERDPEGFKQLRTAYDQAIEASRYLSADDLNPVDPEEGREDSEAAEKEAPSEEQDRDDPDTGQDQQADHSESRPALQSKPRPFISGRREDADQLAHITTGKALFRAMEQLYSHPGERHKKDRWIALFERCQAVGLERYPEFEQYAVGFICQNSLLPPEVLEAFDHAFHFTQETVRFQDEPWYQYAKYLLNVLRTQSLRLPYPDPDCLPGEPRQCLYFLAARRVIEDRALFQSAPAQTLEETYWHWNNPNRDTALIAFIAEKYLLEGAPDRAIEFLNTDAESEYDEGILTVLGDSLYESGRYQQALSAYQRICSFYSADSQQVPDRVTKGIGLSLMALDQYEAALGVLAPLVDRHPEDYWLRMQLMFARKRRMRALSGSEEDRDCLELAGLLFDAGQYEDCLDLLKDRQSYLLSISDPLLAKCHARVGNHQTARSEFWAILNAAWERNENTIDLVVEYIVLFAGQLSDAGLQQLKAATHDDLVQIERMAEWNAEYAYAIALLNYYVTRFSKPGENLHALFDYTNHYIDRAVSIEPLNPVYHCLRTYAYSDRCRPESMSEFIRSGEIARSYDYTKPRINIGLANAYYRTGNYSAAERIVRFGLKLALKEREHIELIDLFMMICCDQEDYEKAAGAISDFYDGPKGDLKLCCSCLDLVLLECRDNHHQPPDSLIELTLRALKDVLASEHDLYGAFMQLIDLGFTALGETDPERRAFYQQQLDDLFEAFRPQKERLDEQMASAQDAERLGGDD